MRKFNFIICLALSAFLLCACGTKSSSVKTISIEPIKQSTAEPAPAVKSIPTEAPTDGLKSDGKIHVYIVGEGEKVNTPESSFIKYITYYSESKHLIINMSGKDYVFANIDSSLWQKFVNAESKGTFYNNNIKGVSSYRINDYSTGDGDKIVIEYLP